MYTFCMSDSHSLSTSLIQEWVIDDDDNDGEDEVEKDLGVSWFPLLPTSPWRIHLHRVPGTTSRTQIWKLGLVMARAWAEIGHRDQVMSVVWEGNSCLDLSGVCSQLLQQITSIKSDSRSITRSLFKLVCIQVVDFDLRMVRDVWYLLITFVIKPEWRLTPIKLINDKMRATPI